MKRIVIALAMGLALLSCEVSNPVAPPDSTAGGGGTSGSGAADFVIEIVLPEDRDVIVNAQPIKMTITVTTNTAEGKSTSPTGQIYAVTTTLGTLSTKKKETGKKEVSNTFDVDDCGPPDTCKVAVNFFPGNTPGDAQLFVTVGNTVKPRIVTVKPRPEAPVADFMAQISDLRVLFTNTSTGTNLKNEWDFGDGCMFDDSSCIGCPSGVDPDICMQTDPVRDYAGPGAYAVKLTVREDTEGGRSSDRSQLLDIGTLPEPPEEPVAMFTAEPQPGGLQVIFRDASTGPPTSWAWDFGDPASEDPESGTPGANTSAEQNPVHTFSQAGDFLVSLTVNNSTGLANKTSQFVAAGADIPELEADFTFVVSESGLIVTFTDASTGEPDSYLWDFGDGSTSAEQNPIHEYVIAKEYQVSLTVKKAGKPDSTAQKLVAAGAPPPTAEFDWSPKNAPGTPNGLTILFEDKSGNDPTSWVWTFGDDSPGVSCGQGQADTSNACRNPVHTYTGSDNYVVKLVVGNSGGSDDASKVVEVDSGLSPPEARFTFQKIGGLTVDFRDQSLGPPTSWEWDFKDGTPKSNEQNPIHEFPSSGDFNVRLTVTNLEGSDFIEQFVRFSSPKADFAFRQDGPLKMVFTDQSTGGATSWEWDFGDGCSTANCPFDTVSSTYKCVNTVPPVCSATTCPECVTQSPTHTYGAAGTYSVRLGISTDQGLTDTVVKSVTVDP